MDSRVEAVIALMKEDPHRMLTLSSMARSVNLSPSRLYYLFNLENRMPPVRYLRIVRLQAAKHLLETTFLSVKEIVALVGGNDESHFLRNFKKLYGVTPGELRAQVSGSSPVKPGNRLAFHLTGSLANDQ